MMEWKPIGTAPKDNQEILVSGFIRNDMNAGRWVSQGVRLDDSDQWILTDDAEYSGECFYPPTHWMPLPSPPKD